MSQPMWVVKLLKKYFPQRFRFAAWTRLPVFGRVMDEIIFKDDNILYLPKDTVVIQQAIQPDNVMLPSEVVDHFIREARYRWIMNECICRSAAHCEDYPVEFGCLFLGQAVLEINPKLGRLVSVEEALAHEQRCREAGLFQMIGRDKLDTLWMGVTPGSKLLTICNCCPCCCLFKMLPKLAAPIGNRVSMMPGVSVSVSDACVGCGTCTQGVCFVDALAIGEDGTAFVNNDCRGCGHCVEVCPTGAIELKISDASFVEQSIRRLSSTVDVH